MNCKREKGERGPEFKLASCYCQVLLKDLRKLLPVDGKKNWVCAGKLTGRSLETKKSDDKSEKNDKNKMRKGRLCSSKK